MDLGSRRDTEDQRQCVAAASSKEVVTAHLLVSASHVSLTSSQLARATLLPCENKRKGKHSDTHSAQVTLTRNISCPMASPWPRPVVIVSQGSTYLRFSFIISKHCCCFHSSPLLSQSMQKNHISTFLVVFHFKSCRWFVPRFSLAAL